MNLGRTLLLSALLAGPGLLSRAEPEATRPNVVIVFIDDLGYGDIGPFGATKQKTPNLDRMAREGMRLTSFYAAPVCSVSRAQLLTGCYGARISVPGVYPPGARNGLNPAEQTIAERLKDLGYATMCIGKWHVGDQPDFLPLKQGFDHYLGIPYSNDMQRKSREKGVPVVPLVRDGQVLELLTEEDQTRIVERYTDEAVRFIRTNSQKPFLLYFPHTAVHTPIHPGAAFAGKSANGRFGDWVEEVDWSVGRVLDTLRELKIDQNTLVVFTSDNGPWLIKGKDAGNAGPLRGGKGSTWEGGVRVPTIAWWPGKIAAGTSSDAVAGTIDLLPTAVTLACGQIAAEPKIDGRDLSPLLFGKTQESARDAHYYFSNYHLQAVRQGPWKLAIAAQRESMGKDVAPDVQGNEVRLYHLGDDIGERKNVAADHPDVVKKLQALADAMQVEIGGDKPTARRPAGEVAEPKVLYDTDDEPKGKKQRTSRGKPAVTNLEALKPGGTLAGDAAPQVGDVAFAISCTIETEQKDAVVLAHGGASIGYALHLKEGRVHFAIRSSANANTEIASAPISGSTPIVASLAPGGKMSLKVGEQPEVTGRAAGLLGHQPQEDFCLGHDNKVPVASYATMDPFRGRITALTITTH